MFSPFATPNFSIQLQNQIRANFQHQHSNYQVNTTQSTLPQSYQGDPFLYQNFQNPPQFYSPSHHNHNSNCDDECHEFIRKPTFFGLPLFGSETLTNHIAKKVGQNDENLPTNQNPETINTQSKHQNDILSLSTFELPEILATQSIAKQQNQQLQINQNERIMGTFEENQKQEVSETQKLFEIFDQEELQSKKKETGYFPSIIREQSQEESFQKIYDESIIEELNSMKVSQAPETCKASFLKQISSKIRKSRIQCHQRSDSNKFSLKQFNQTIKRAKEVPLTPKGHHTQSQQLYQAIFDLVRKREEPVRKEPQEMENIVHKLKQSILPHFQKLENDYTEKITQMNELIQAMISLNLNKNNLQEKDDDSKPKKEEKRLYNVTQSVIRINLNDQEGSQQYKSHSRSKDYFLEQIEEEVEKKHDRSIIEAPVITRTDSSEGLFVSNRSSISQIDILASVNSRADPIKINDDI